MDREELGHDLEGWRGRNGCLACFRAQHRLECSAQPDMDGARLPLDRIGMKSQIFDRRPTEEKSSLGTWSDNRPGPCVLPPPNIPCCVWVNVLDIRVCINICL